jgi:hypothetical protein
MDDHNTSGAVDASSSAVGALNTIVPSRIMVLFFLESVCKSSSLELLKPKLQALTVSLVAMNMQQVNFNHFIACPIYDDLRRRSIRRLRWWEPSYLG